MCASENTYTDLDTIAPLHTQTALVRRRMRSIFQYAAPDLDGSGNEFRIELSYARVVEFQNSMETIQPKNGRGYDGTLKIGGKKAKFNLR